LNVRCRRVNRVYFMGTGLSQNSQQRHHKISIKYSHIYCEIRDKYVLSFRVVENFPRLGPHGLIIMAVFCHLCVDVNLL
jgi:hypothetical protein